MNRFAAILFFIASTSGLAADYAINDIIAAGCRDHGTGCAITGYEFVAQTQLPHKEGEQMLRYKLGLIQRICATLPVGVFTDKRQGCYERALVQMANSPRSGETGRGVAWDIVDYCTTGFERAWTEPLKSYRCWERGIASHRVRSKIRLQSLASFPDGERASREQSGAYLVWRLKELPADQKLFNSNKMTRPAR